jgi:hypothetical protein
MANPNPAGVSASSFADTLTFQSRSAASMAPLSLGGLSVPSAMTWSGGTLAGILAFALFLAIFYKRWL